MLLLFDLGNTRCKWARADDRLHPGAPIEYGAGFRDVLDAALGALPAPTRALAVSVADEATTATLGHWVHSRYGLTLVRMAVRAAQCGVTNRYDRPEQLGVDRWAALIGARARTTQAVCVVNGGTAVTIDALDSHGVFQGGVILPGLGLQRTALLRSTHGIKEVEGDSRSCLARNTADAVAAGTLQGLAGAIERVVAEQARALNAKLKVFLAGGDSAQLSPLLRFEHESTPHLVLEGLYRMAQES